MYLFNVVELFDVNKMGALGPRLGALRPKLESLWGQDRCDGTPSSPRLKTVFWKRKINFMVVFLGESSHSDLIEPPLKKYRLTSMTPGGYFEALSGAPKGLVFGKNFLIS